MPECAACGRETNYVNEEWTNQDDNLVCDKCSFALLQSDTNLDDCNDDIHFHFYRMIYGLDGDEFSKVSDRFGELAKYFLESWVTSGKCGTLGSDYNRAEREAACILYLTSLIDPHSKLSQNKFGHSVSNYYEEVVEWADNQDWGDFKIRRRGPHIEVIAGEALDLFNELEEISERRKELESQEEKLRNEINEMRRDSVAHILENNIEEAVSRTDQ